MGTTGDIDDTYPSLDFSTLGHMGRAMMKDEMKLLNIRVDGIYDMLQRVLERQVIMQEMLTLLNEKLDEEFFWDADDDYYGEEDGYCRRNDTILRVHRKEGN